MTIFFTIFFIFLGLNLLTLYGFVVAIQINVPSPSPSPSPSPKFPAVLIFGDSTMDTGNNKYIQTSFQCNKPPYGENFPGSFATGRCSNGRIPPDILASMIGLKEFIPPFLNSNLSNSDVITGVCFASAGSGYDERTTALSNVISMSRQLPYFKEYIQRLEGIVGKIKADGILNHALVIVSAATNDIIISFPTRRAEMTIEQYQDFLLNELQKFVKEIYYLGSRNIVVIGLPPVGCLPLQLTLNLQILRQCIDKQNEDAQIYNKKLRENILPQLQAELPNSTIIYGDIYNPLIDMIIKPQNYGLVESRSGCCGTGILEVGPLCSKISPLCKNPNEYLFFDSIHPTEAAYKIIVQNLTDSNYHNFF